MTQFTTFQFLFFLPFPFRFNHFRGFTNFVSCRWNQPACYFETGVDHAKGQLFMNTNDDLARIARNRENASHSTGPKTEAGKQRSSLNALRHGLTGHTIVLPSEDLAAYQRFTKRFFDDLKPQGILEEQLVQTLADTSWRLNR